MTDQKQCCVTCLWGRETSLKFVNCECPIPDAALKKSSMQCGDGRTCPTYQPKGEPMTDPLEHTEQQRQAIAKALEELEAAANAWRDSRTQTNTIRLEIAVHTLREARTPKPSLLQRARRVDEFVYDLYEKVRDALASVDANHATAEDIAVIERWEREMEGTK